MSPGRRRATGERGRYPLSPCADTGLQNIYSTCTEVLASVLTMFSVFALATENVAEKSNGRESEKQTNKQTNKQKNKKTKKQK